MNRPLPILFVFFTGLITLCALSTALASTTSSLASSAASAAASTALLTSQCVNGLMVVVAIVAGIGIGVGFVALRSSYQQKQAMQRSPYTPTLPSVAWNLPTLPESTNSNENDDDALTQALISIIQQERR